MIYTFILFILFLFQIIMETILTWSLVYTVHSLIICYVVDIKIDNDI
jgi:hypothetical protein